MDQAALNRNHTQRQFQAPVAQGAAVENLRPVAGRRLQGPGEQQISDAFLVYGRLQVGTALQERRVKPSFELHLALRLQCHHSSLGRQERRRGAVQIGGIQLRELLSEEWLVPRRPERDPGLDLGQESGLRRDAKGDRRLGVGIQGVRIAGVAALVRSQPDGQQQALMEGQELLLGEEAEVLDRLPGAQGLVGRPCRRQVQTADQVFTGDAILRQVLRLVL